MSSFSTRFFKTVGEYCDIPSINLSVMLSLPKPLDEIKLNLVCELHEWGVHQHFGGGPGEGSKSKISLNFKYEVNYKESFTKLCVCSHK